MNYYRASYLPASIQETVYNRSSWPRNTLKSYAPHHRAGYARPNQTASFAPRVPTLIRQSAPMTEAIFAPAVGKLAVA